MQANDPDHMLLCERFPDLERLTLFVAFEEADAEAEPNYQQIIFTEDSAVAFRLDCARDDCSSGGFDYEPMIDKLMSSGAPQTQGKIACQGVLGNGAEPLPCGLQSEYRIIVQRKP